MPHNLSSFEPVFFDSTLPALPATAGGKAVSLQRLHSAGMPVPPTLFIPQGAYTNFIRQTGLLPYVEALTLHSVEALRWEEIWDISLTLRNKFTRQEMPEEIATPILQAISRHFSDAPLAVRSCAEQEDSGFSHAGMHDTLLHISGGHSVLRAIRQVWASLWSDRAIMYRREMGLDPRQSAMGVLIQPMFAGALSGVLFTRNPLDETQMVVEAAAGPARCVVDDSVETEQTVLNYEHGHVLSRRPPRQKNATLLAEQKIEEAEQITDEQEEPDYTTQADSKYTEDECLSQPPVILSEALLTELHALGQKVEQLFAGAQDIEWTWVPEAPAPEGDTPHVHTLPGRFVLLQSRPVTTLASSGNREGWKAQDQRPWYLSLTRSHANLEQLRNRIEQEILPGMLEDSTAMQQVDLAHLSCSDIAQELDRRKERLGYWRDTYWRELIPFAHAVRQFGMLYNDAVAPEDPFEFTTLLTGQDLLALERNALLETMSRIAANDQTLTAQLQAGLLPEKGPYITALHDFMERFGDLSCGSSWCDEGPWGIVRLTLDAAPNAPRNAPAQFAAELEETFFAAFPEERHDFARSVLELARVSYRLRDDDNMYLGKIQARYDEAMARAVKCGVAEKQPEARSTMPKGHAWRKHLQDHTEEQVISGWAAAAGIASGAARVISGPDDLFAFRQGEILICDALDPNMTFVVPLAAGIVERRGGMLVHGAIIAREYGIPCVTGIPDATTSFATGEMLLVDGFRGTVARNPHPVAESTSRNVEGTVLQTCCKRPMTGFFRSGACDTTNEDAGRHVVCAIVTDAFLEFTRQQGNDLTTPAPHLGFPGLAAGDCWCLCASRWEEARQAGVAPPVILAATHEEALQVIPLHILSKYAADEE